MRNAFIKYIFSSEDNGMKRILLFPLTVLSWLYRLAVNLRNRACQKGILASRKLRVPVISIGNVTVGGTGKTPAVIYLAQVLLERGKRVAALSRGYKGKASKNVNVVSDGQRILLTPEEGGDEPCLIAARLPGVPVLIGKDRWRLGEYALENFSVDTVLLDDGFQHLKLKRDVDIVLLDGKRPLGNGYLLPRGNLREPPESLSRAQIILVTNGDNDEAKLREIVKPYNQAAPLFFADYIPVELEKVKSQEKIPLDYLRGREIAALAGLARPESFVSLLIQMGANVKKTIFFPDHYHYRAQDIERIDKDMVVVTTEKDAVKMKNLPLPEREILVLRIEFKIGREEEFFDYLKKYLPS